jgi:hypothetical protein
MWKMGEGYDRSLFENILLMILKKKLEPRQCLSSDMNSWLQITRTTSVLVSSVGTPMFNFHHHDPNVHEVHLVSGK